MTFWSVTAFACWAAVQGVAMASSSGTIAMDRGARIANMLTLPAVVLAVGITVLARRALRRARVRALAARAGRLSADIDWTSDRVHAVTWFPRRTVPWLVGWLVVLLCQGACFFILANSRVMFWPVEAFIAVVCGTFLAWGVFRGGAQVRFDRFPYAVGERATFFVAMTEGSPRLEHARFLLRCVQAGGVVFRGAGRTHPDATLWDQPCDAPPEQWPGPEEFVEVSFDIPADLRLPCTALHGEPVVRWELLVLGRTRWGRVMETFVVPVYAPAS